MSSISFAAGVTAALGGFNAWLSGLPGKPAPQREQERFDAANERSLAAFPKGTQLRELIRTKVDGKLYVFVGSKVPDQMDTDPTPLIATAKANWQGLQDQPYK